MKKLLYSFLLVALVVPQIAFAGYFKPATLYKGKDLKAVYSQSQANKLFKDHYKLYRGQKLGSQVVTDFSVRLSASITTSQVTVPVTSMVTKDNHTLTIADFGATAYLTVEPGSSREEIVKCTGISGNSFTGCTRGLAFYGTSTAAVTNNQYSHQSGSSVILSNVHYVYLGYADLDTAQTFTGVKTFTVSPIAPTPSTASQVAIKSYVDGVAIAGSPDASTVVKGISKLSTNPASSTNPIALNSEEVATTSGANKVVRASSTGLIDPAWYQGNINSFSASTTFTSTTTFNGYTIGAGFTHIQVISTIGTSTWTRPVGVTRIKVRVQGAGGNGGSISVAADYSSGGGAGGYLEKIIDVSSVSSTTVFVGTSTGIATTSFGIYASTTRGLDGLLASSGGFGGDAFSGDINIKGAPGCFGVGSGGRSFSGNGGNSILGSGGLGVNTTANGNNGNNYGGGGSGANTLVSGTQTGGLGAQGVIIVEY